MFKALIDWLVIILTRKVCTASQFVSVCEKAITYANKDEDGMISVSELLYYVLSSLRKG